VSLTVVELEDHGLPRRIRIRIPIPIDPTAATMEDMTWPIVAEALGGLVTSMEHMVVDGTKVVIMSTDQRMIIMRGRRALVGVIGRHRREIMVGGNIRLLCLFVYIMGTLSWEHTKKILRK